MRLLKEIYTPNSILEKTNQYIPISIGKRSRFATCTAVCWLTSDIIASLNLYGNSIVTYCYNPVKNDFTILQEITNEDGARLSMSEHMSISPCGKLIAVCSAPPLSNPTPKSCVNIYRFLNNKINPIPVFSVEEEHLIHNVRFTPNGKYLSYTTYQDERAIITCKIDDHISNFKLLSHEVKNNIFFPMKPKCLNFTKDGNFLIVAYCIGLVNFTGEISSCLVCYKLNENGHIGEMVSKLYQNRGMEDIVFSPDNDYFFVSDQANDIILKYAFNNLTGEICYMDRFNPEEAISFPHGMSISKDGKHLAVANYGDDKFNLYEI